MEGICAGESIVIGINLLFGLLGTKQGAVVWKIKQQKDEEVSAVLLFGMLFVNFLKNILLGVLVALQVGVFLSVFD